MNKKIVVLLIVSCFAQHKNLWCDPIITFFAKPYPIEVDNDYSKEIVHKFGQPGKLAKQTFYGLGKEQFIAGIFSMYAGFLNTSDANGQTMFPRWHQAPQVYLLITNRMTPIIMSGNTIHHWELEEGTPAQMFSVARQTDDELKLSYWDVQEMPLPENNRIPLEALVIIAEPRHIHVPVGITPTTENPNLVLPSIYTKRGINTLTNALYLLNVKHFFGPLDAMYVRNPKRYAQHIKQ